MSLSDLAQRSLGLDILESFHSEPNRILTITYSNLLRTDRIAQSVARQTQESEVPGSISGPSTDSRRAVYSYW